MSEREWGDFLANMKTQFDEPPPGRLTPFKSRFLTSVKSAGLFSWFEVEEAIQKTIVYWAHRMRKEAPFYWDEARINHQFDFDPKTDTFYDIYSDEWIAWRKAKGEDDPDPREWLRNLRRKSRERECQPRRSAQRGRRPRKKERIMAAEQAARNNRTAPRRQTQRRTQRRRAQDVTRGRFNHFRQVTAADIEDYVEEELRDGYTVKQILYAGADENDTSWFLVHTIFNITEAVSHIYLMNPEGEEEAET